MNGFRITLTFSLLYIFVAAKPQVPDISNDLRHLNTIMSDMNYRENRRNWYAQYEGSPYIDEEFYPGTISFAKKKFTNLLIRYNYYEGYFEYKENDEIKYFNYKTSRVDTVWINEIIFVPVNFYSGNSLRQSYMELLKSGRTQVFLRKFITLLEPQEAKGYQEAIPARFNIGTEEIYIRIADDAAWQFKGKKSIKEIFPDHHDELENYSKKRNLKLREQNDIIKLCIFYDELN